MTTENDAGPQPDYAAAAEMLEALANGGTLQAIADAIGAGKDTVSANFRLAATALRKAAAGQPLPLKSRWPASGSILDWRDMTVAEALEVLAGHAMKMPGGSKAE